MDRAELAALDKDALIELIVRLAERATELEARVGRPPKGPGNSSIPPSAGYKPNRTERRRKKRGPKKGHQGLSRRRVPPDVVVQCRPAACRRCGAALAETGQRRVRRSEVVERPELRPVVFEAHVYAARCAACGKRTVGEALAGLEPARTFGPGVEALLGYLHERHHVGYARLVELCRDVFGLAISQGGVENALRRLVERARPAYEALGTAVRASPAIGSDETVARVVGTTAWHWVFQTPEVSYHVIMPRRNADVIAAFLGDTRPEGSVSDPSPSSGQALWASQVRVAADAHQLCLAHQIRDLTYADEADGYAGRLGAVELRHLLGRAIHLGAIRDILSPASFAGGGSSTPSTAWSAAPSSPTSL